VCVLFLFFFYEITLNSLPLLLLCTVVLRSALKQSSSSGSHPIPATVLHQCVYWMGPGLAEGFRKTVRGPVGRRFEITIAMPNITLSLVQWVQLMNYLINTRNKTWCQRQGQESQNKHQLTKDQTTEKLANYFTNFGHKKWSSCRKETRFGFSIVCCYAVCLFVCFGLIFLVCLGAVWVHVTSIAFEMYCKHPVYVIVPKGWLFCFASRQSCRKPWAYILQSNGGTSNTKQKLTKSELI